MRGGERGAAGEGLAPLSVDCLDEPLKCYFLGIAAFCFKVWLALGPSSQLKVGVESKIKWIIAANPNRKMPCTTIARSGSYNFQIRHIQ
jgi:hypothetical protein